MIGIDQLTNRKLNFIEEYPFVLQRRKNDCGIACIEMVCLYYSVKNYKNIIGEISLNEKGLSIEKMSNVLNELGFINVPWIYRCAESACPVFWKSPVRKEEIMVSDR